MPIVPFPIPGILSNWGFATGTITVIHSDRRVGTTTLFLDFTRHLELAKQDFLVVTANHQQSRAYGNRAVSDMGRLRQRLYGRRIHALIVDSPGDEFDPEGLRSLPLDGVAVVIGSAICDGFPPSCTRHEYKFIEDERVLSLENQHYALRQTPSGLQALPYSASYGVLIKNRFELMLCFDPVS